MECEREHSASERSFEKVLVNPAAQLTDEIVPLRGDCEPCIVLQSEAIVRLLSVRTFDAEFFLEQRRVGKLFTKQPEGLVLDHALRVCPRVWARRTKRSRVKSFESL